jgi:ABC-type branched-subunit amino acid transport system substrate-binding protein
LQSKNSISSFQKLRDVDGINVLVNASSGTGNALASLAEARNVTLFSIASDPEISRNRKYVFNFWISPEDEIKAIFPEVEKRKYKKIALFSTIHSGALTLKNEFIQQNNGRLEVVMQQDLDPTVRDFRSFLIKLKSVQNLDAIQLILLPGQLGLFAKQARQFGINVDLFSYEFFEDPAEVKASAGALIGQWYVQGYDGEPTFVERYQQKFPNQSMWGSANGHDTIRLMAAALEQGVQPSEFNKFLYDLKDFKGALGVYSSNGKNWFSLPVILKVVTNNGFDRLYP